MKRSTLILTAVFTLAAPLMATLASAQTSATMPPAQTRQERLAGDKMKAIERERNEKPGAADARLDQQRLAGDKARAMGHNRLADDKARALQRERTETPTAGDARADEQRLAADKARAEARKHRPA